MVSFERGTTAGIFNSQWNLFDTNGKPNRLLAKLDYSQKKLFFVYEGWFVIALFVSNEQMPQFGPSYQNSLIVAN